LSVQVHPDDEYARLHESAAGGVGKTEMWYAVAARPGAELFLGMEPAVTREIFQQALTTADVERCLTRLPVQAGDAFFVPAGTAHTIGPGMLLCEVQEHSDITYRVFDYNRRQADGSTRPLHIRQALEVLRFGNQRCGQTRGMRIEQGPVQKTFLAACSHFAAEIWEFSETATGTTSPECFELLVALEGRGRIQWRCESMPLAAGEAWLIPAALGDYHLIPQSQAKLLRAYVPDLEKLSRELAEHGLSESQCSAVLHR
jgi:mannose-6-phosphate isomerase